MLLPVSVTSDRDSSWQVKVFPSVCSVGVRQYSSTQKSQQLLWKIIQMWFLNISSEFCKPLTSACPRSVQVRMWWTGSTVTSRVSPTAVKLASTQATCWRPVTSVTPSTRWPSPSSATTCSETSVEVRRITQQSTPFINIQVSEGTKLGLKMWTQLKCLELQYHQWSQDGDKNNQKVTSSTRWFKPFS